MKQILFILYILISIKGISQIKKIDSLRTVLQKTNTDTTRVNALNAISWEFRNKTPDSSIYYGRQAFLIAQKIKFEIGQAESYLLIGTAYSNLGKLDDALLILVRAKRIFEKLSKVDKKENYRIKRDLSRVFNSIGNVYSTLGNYGQSLKNHQSALILRNEIGDKPGVASSYNNIGIVYKDQGNYVEALKNHFASLKIKESLNNNEGIAISYNNIGVIYKYQGNNEEALIHFKNSLKIAEKIGLTDMITTCYLNIGAIYTAQKKYDEGLKNYLKAYDIAERNANDEAISDVYGNIGALYTDKEMYDEALENLLKALKIKEVLEDNASISSVQNIIAENYHKKGDIKNAMLYGEKSLALAKKMRALKQIQESSYSMIAIYQKAKIYQKAFEMRELYTQVSDSILNKSNQREVMRQEFKYNYDKQSYADSLNYENEKKIYDLENQVKLKSEKNIRIILYIGLALVMFFSMFIFNRFRITTKQKNIIEQQSNRLSATHKQLTVKTKEINDSILYSKEIQNTFLKSPTNSKKYFKDTLLVYKPKDVVSGDFYWYKEFDDNLFVVVGDCTGHGVPGAIISVLAIQCLEKTIDKIKNNEKIHELNEHIRNEFNAYYNLEGHVSIGLDYSIICINKKYNKLYISGSGSNVLIKDEHQLSAYKFDTINIGGSAPVVYEPTTISLDLQSVRSIFLYTDGVIDQKGCDTGKKYGTKKLKELLLNLNTNDATVAVKKIEEEIDNWMGTNEQIDDMTLLGIQISHI